MQQPDLYRRRIIQIDLLRGVIMIIMALDHVRDFFHQPALITDPLNLDTTTLPVFFTRVITHFCAPGFVFLSGISAYLSGQHKIPRQLSRFLITRGLWLIILEIGIMSLIFTFNPNYNFILLGVIWAIGCSMIILGLLVRTSNRVILITGLIIFFGHNITDLLGQPSSRISGTLLNVFITSPGFILPLAKGHVALVAYAILPWTGIMLLGYAAGQLYSRDFDPARRKKLLLRIGFGLIMLFLLLRLPNLYGDPNKWSVQKNFTWSVLSFLQVTKYPVSLQYACMTLGPVILFLALAGNRETRFTRFAVVYGRVPLFYYIFHFLLIHLLCVAVFFATGHTMAQAVDPGSIFLFRPVNFGFRLWIVYLIWMGIVLSLYYPCKWYGEYKRRSGHWWLSYL